MNPRLGSLVAELKRVARDDGGAVWADVAETLQGPRSRHAEVNLSRIDRYATEGETVVVPGKVLGSGALRTPIAVGAVDFSASAETKIEQADGEALELEALLADNPEGANVRVIR